MVRLPVKRFTTVCILLLCTGVFAGCASLPDFSPFATATADMSSAVIASGTTIESALQPIAGWESFATQFAKDWQTRKQAMHGMVEYADGLNQITQAGRSGADSAGALADSLTGLATAAGMAVPGGSVVVSTVTKAAKLIYEQIALVRAARSLKNAMASAQPVIDRVTEIIVQDLKAGGDVFLLAHSTIRGDIQLENQVQLGFRHQLIGARDELYKKGVSALSATESARLLEIGQLIASADAWYQPMQEQLQQVQKRLNAGRNLIAAASDATMQWRIVHHNLVAALQQGGNITISAPTLAQAAVQIRGLINRMREL